MGGREVQLTARDLLGERVVGGPNDDKDGSQNSGLSISAEPETKKGSNVVAMGI